MDSASASDSMDLDDLFAEDNVMLERFQKYKRDKRDCCKRSCFRMFDGKSAEMAWKEADKLRQMSKGKSKRSALWKVFLRTCYQCSKYGQDGTRKSKALLYVVPYYHKLVCGRFFMEFYQVSHYWMVGMSRTCIQRSPCNTVEQLQGYGAWRNCGFYEADGNGSRFALACEDNIECKKSSCGTRTEGRN